MVGTDGKRIRDARSGCVFNSGQASLIFFNSRRQSFRKSWTVRLSLALAGCAPNWL